MRYRYSCIIDKVHKIASCDLRGGLSWIWWGLFFTAVPVTYIFTLIIYDHIASPLILPIAKVTDVLWWPLQNIQRCQHRTEGIPCRGILDFSLNNLVPSFCFLFQFGWYSLQGWPTAGESNKLAVSCRFFIITGVILLVSSTRLIARLPRPVQKFLKSNMERTHSIRRPGSARGKDPIPTTTIHTSSLHLLTSPTKEKA